MHGQTVGDLAGEVVEVGSGVTNFKQGDKVISISFPVRFYLHASH
jgi:NADPH:quinone reductase-like Zn-dependent oxidoreductase